MTYSCFTIDILAIPSCVAHVQSIAFLIIVMRICSNATPPPELPRQSMIQVTAAPSCGGMTNMVPPAGVHDRRRLSLADVEPPQSPSSLRSLPIAIHVSVLTTSDQESVASFERESPSSITKILGGSEEMLEA